MKTVLVTGMSGVGKSTALEELRRHGFLVVDTDEPGWTEWSEVDGGYVWREERIEALLDRKREKTLYVSGAVSNQGRFYARFDAVVLLSAPADVMLERIESRNTNDHGKRAEERADVLRNLTEVEPLLRATCTHELDATRSVDHVVSELIGIGTAATT